MGKTKPCAGCRQPIYWRETPTGSRMPLDVKPIEEWAKGAYVMDDDEKCRPATPEDTDTLYMNHWATCPAHSQFRAKKGGKMT